MITYNERRQKLAEEMAITHTMYGKVNSAYDRLLVSKMLPLADIALKHMAKAADDAYIEGLTDNTRDSTARILYLDSQGLTQPSTNL